ncbi:MAG: hypothetical protein C4324_00530 [Blastocatellia bacterium]
MKSLKISLTSVILIIGIFISGPAATIARFDEGMFMPDKIASLPLKQRGLKIATSDIYRPGGGGLSDAVIRLSIGCTAEFVSPDGLILTNHHCGFDALVSASTPSNDLVENGFRAEDRSREIPAKGYSIFITEREEDVTEKILTGTQNLAGDAFAATIKRNIDNLIKEEQANAPKGSTIRIQGLNNGYYYYLLQTRQISDIRVVYAPPRSIGIFGGDPDNFEWPRHTGDFTFLRAYVGPDGSAAPYSPTNVPYKPRKYLTINIGGLKENDFVFVLGYPGNTTRYRESQSIKYARDDNFPFLAAWLRARSDALKQIGADEEEKRIKFQSDIASFDNAFKVYDGGALRLRKAKVFEKRQEDEVRLAAWINADPGRKHRYGNLLSEIAALYDATSKTSKLDILVRRMPDATMPVFRAIYQAVADGKMLDDAARQSKLEELKTELATREPVYEYEMIRFFLREFDKLPAGQKFDGTENLFGKLKGKARRDAEDDFARTIAMGKYWNADTIAALYGPQTQEFRPERDNVRAFASALKSAKEAANARAAEFATKIDRLRLEYLKAMAEMRGLTPYPDANSTLRFSFGNVKGYSPREAEYRSPFTTLKGMLEKDTGIEPFDMPHKLKELLAARDFGKYGAGDTVTVNFLATADIIGGNSGSPVLNGNGEQVGLVFDGNYEGLGNDFYYDPDKNRTIAVDIRFVLFVTEKFGNAGWIVNEMKITGRPKSAAAAQ